MVAMSDDEDDFQNNTTYSLLPLSLPPPSTNPTSSRPPLKPSNSQAIFPRPCKKPKPSIISSGKENRPVGPMLLRSSERVCSSIPEEQAVSLADDNADCPPAQFNDVGLYGYSFGGARAFQSNFSIESRLMGSRYVGGGGGGGGGVGDDDESDEKEDEQADDGTQLDLCFAESQDVVANGIPCLTEEYGSGGGKVLLLVQCPLCGVDISDLNEEQRQVHSNHCLDKGQSPNDLISIGVTALGPRKKIMHTVDEFRRQGSSCEAADTFDTSHVKVDETSKVAVNKLITDFFTGSVTKRSNFGTVDVSNVKSCKRSQVHCDHKQAEKHRKNTKLKDIPLWCCIPGTPFRVDAFRYLRSDCSHWFLTHFHIDHYQGLTKSFSHGKIYCSLITARLVNLKLGIPWERLHVLPLNEKITIFGIDVMCIDANHCPGSIIILFEPPDGKAVLHTGDFRYSEDMVGISALMKPAIHTLILDTTYCNPEFDFPKLEAVVQFVIEVIQAEAFNRNTLFLIGSYTIGKEKLFLEVARVLRQKVYVTLAKLRLMQCLELPEEDMKLLTSDEHESCIHVVPMWTLASFKRLKHVANQYANRFNLIVAFSPTGWTFGKGKKKSPGRRWQQGTIIRYEVPYSEHCSFTELKEFVKLISPANIIPSVNNDGPESSSAMVSALLC